MPGLFNRGRRNSTDPTEVRWSRITELVDGALKRPDPADRSRYLKAASGGDRDLLREVENLLKFEHADSGILGEPLLERSEAMGLEAVLGPSPQPGQRFGPYEIRRILGHGGMGVVALARNVELDRLVALKIMRGEKASPEFLYRFEAERRILAQLDHPNIATLYESGSADGLPYFAMEYVEGQPIDNYCDEHRLLLPERIRLVLKICDALAEVHRHLVIHRDLKPSNILVTADGEPKLLDFGIAKQLDGAGNDAITRTGQQPGTPAYASPEQVRNLAVTAATDVYSLGILLYRLLTGHPPYSLDGDTFQNIRTICTEQPAPASSQAMLVLEVWEDGAPKPVSPELLAHLRRTKPEALRRLLQGDLDSIVAKTLEKRSEDRYSSIQELADDLRNHLVGLPVSARRSSLVYRLNSFLRRRIREVAVVSILVAGGIAGFLAWFDEKRAAGAAVRQAHEAERLVETIASFVGDVFEPVPKNQAFTIEELLQFTYGRVREELQGEPELLVDQLEILGLVYLRSLNNPRAAIPFLETSLQGRREIYEGSHPMVARGINNLATAYYYVRDMPQAESLFREALAIKSSLGLPLVDLTRVESNLAAILTFQGKYGEAELLLKKILKIRKLAYGPEDGDVSNTLRSLGTLYYLRGDFDAAEALLRQALEIRLEENGSKSPRVAAVESSLGRVMYALGRFEDSAKRFETVLQIRESLLKEDDVNIALVRKDLAAAYYELGRPEEAQLLFEQALRVLEAKSPDGWELADARSQLGARLAAAGKLEEAEPLLRESYQVLKNLRGEKSIYARQAYERLQALP